MECLWRLYGHWRQDGHRYQPYPTIFYVCFTPHNGLPYHYLHGAGFLEKYAQVYESGKEKSLVLSLIKDRIFLMPATLTQINFVASHTSAFGSLLSNIRFILVR